TKRAILHLPDTERRRQTSKGLFTLNYNLSQRAEKYPMESQTAGGYFQQPGHLPRRQITELVGHGIAREPLS
ncbi:hypothetical protein MPER_08978, partial [Moniliophthora perniciosa FA553]